MIKSIVELFNKILSLILIWQNKKVYGAPEREKQKDKQLHDVLKADDLRNNHEFDTNKLRKPEDRARR